MFDNGLLHTTVGAIFTVSSVPYTLVKPYTANAEASAAAAIAAGYLIKNELITTIAKPIDSTTGEAFIKQVKGDVEIANDLSEGHSLNGNSLGVSEDLVLIVKQGIIPAVEVETYAGAFNKQEVAIPARIIVVKDFGSCNSKVYAVLMDGRGMRLHNTYNAVRENPNGDGDFLNLFRHTEDTGFISRNTFVKFYKES